MAVYLTSPLSPSRPLNTYRLLESVADSSYEGLASENLEALKALIPLYAEKFRRIFIDPLYNTKSAFEHYA